MEEVEILEKVEIEDKNRYEESIKAFADTLGERISSLKDKAHEVEQSARSSYNEKIELMNEKRKSLMNHYKDIRETSEARWNEIKHDTSDRVDEIKHETNKAYTGIKNGFSYLFETLKNA